MMADDWDCWKDLPVPEELRSLSRRAARVRRKVMNGRGTKASIFKDLAVLENRLARLALKVEAGGPS